MQNGRISHQPQHGKKIYVSGKASFCRNSESHQEDGRTTFCNQTLTSPCTSLVPLLGISGQDSFNGGRSVTPQNFYNHG
jgi:hypothetical protein